MTNAIVGFLANADLKKKKKKFNYMRIYPINNRMEVSKAQLLFLF